MKLTDLAKPYAWQEFRQSGFLHISNVVDPQKVENLRKEAYRVFRDTGSIAKHAYRNNGRSGFTPPGIEGVTGNKADYSRQFWDSHLDQISEGKFCDHSRRLVDQMRNLAVEMSVIMSGVFYYMEQGLGPLSSGLHKAMLEGDHGLRATHYPPIPAPPDGILFPSHRDFSLGTIFIGGAEPGLQIDKNGTWHDVENPLGDLTLVAGGMLRYWTGGPKHPDRIGGLRHRVIHAADERLSLSHFLEPAADTDLPYSEGLTAGKYIDLFVAATRTKA